MAECKKIFPGEKDIKSHITALEEHALKEWNKGNPDAFLDLSSEDIVYFDPALKSKLMGKKALQSYYDNVRGKIKIDDYAMIEPVLVMMSEAVVLAYDYQVTTAHGTYRMHCTEVYRFQAGGWQITHTHWSFYNDASK